MKKNSLTTLILLIAMILFGLFQILKEPAPLVLKVVTPTILEIDINGNGMLDDNETFCVADTETFTANLKYNSEKLANDTGLTFGQSLAIGYLTDDFARKTIEGKTVKIEPTDKITPECKFAKISVNDKNYSDLLKEEGYTIKNNKPENPDKFKTVLEQATKKNFVILNHRSLKYHTLDCKYGKAARDAVVVLLNEIPAETKPCKFCHVEKHFNKHYSHHRTLSDTNPLPPPPSIINDGNMQLILTDFTTILKPDRECRHAVCKEFVKSINGAKSTIDIAAYGWANIPAVNKALENAKARNVRIRIVYDTNTSNNNYYSETSDFIAKYENNISDKITGNSQLTNMLMHNKFAIFDSQKVYTGSMNFSTTGFSGFNHNNVIIINSQKAAELFEKEFNQMYSGKFHTLKAKSTNNVNLNEGNSILSVFFSPQDKALTNNVAPLIKSSKKYVYIPTFLLTHNAIKNELIAAHSRGVDVRIIIDATNTYARHSAFKELRNSGIPVKVENYAGKMHAKTIIIDDEYLILGSANLSNSGENKNDENLLIIKSSKLAKAYKDYFEYFWSKIPDKYLKHAVKAESKDSIGSCYDGVDNNFNGKIDNAEEACRR